MEEIDLVDVVLQKEVKAEDQEEAKLEEADPDHHPSHQRLQVQCLYGIKRE